LENPEVCVVAGDRDKTHNQIDDNSVGKKYQELVLQKIQWRIAIGT
jgi:hypothetical protein